MKKRVFFAFVGILCTISGCSKNATPSGTSTSPAVVHAASAASSADNPTLSDSRSGHAATTTTAAPLTPEATEALEFINHRLVPSDCTIHEGNTWQICSRNGVLSIEGDKLVMGEDFEENYSDKSPRYSHEITTVAIADLNSDSMKVEDYNFEGGTDAIHVDCKDRRKCVSSVETPKDGSPKQFSNDRLIVSNFSRKDVNEVASYLKRLLLLQQRKPSSAIEREPTEQEALAFMKAHFAPTVNMDGGIIGFHRRLTIEDDELVESQDVTQYGARPGHLEVRVSLKDLDELIVPDSHGVGLICRGVEDHIPSCFFANTGQSSPDHVIMGVTNPEEFSKMLKRLIVLHQ